MLPSWVYTFIAVGVTSVWLLANLIDLARGVAVDAQLHFLMGAVVGATVGVQALDRRHRAEDEKQEADDAGGDSG